jgi:NAD(P)H-dependent flavin oxidoreductase YrpB (nitropropane dioxygenase family)
VLTPAVVDVAREYAPPMLLGHEAMVLSAGGIASGRSLAAALMQGAVGAWCCTRFAASVEANLLPWEKQDILDCDFHGTEKSLIFTGRPLRMKPNRYVRDWEKRGEQVGRMLEEGVVPMEWDKKMGNEVRLPVMMGQVAGAIGEILPAGRIVEGMAREAVKVLSTATSFVVLPRSKL